MCTQGPRVLSLLLEVKVTLAMPQNIFWTGEHAGVYLIYIVAFCLFMLIYFRILNLFILSEFVDSSRYT